MVMGMETGEFGGEQCLRMGNAAMATTARHDAGRIRMEGLTTV